jgi:hypothetical protein
MRRGYREGASFKLTHYRNSWRIWPWWMTDAPHCDRDAPPGRSLWRWTPEPTLASDAPGITTGRTARVHEPSSAVSTWENTYRADGDLVADPSFVPPPPVRHLIGCGWSEGFSVRGAESCTCKSVSGVSP